MNPSLREDSVVFMEKDSSFDVVLFGVWRKYPTAAIRFASNPAAIEIVVSIEQRGTLYTVSRRLNKEFLERALPESRAIILETIVSYIFYKLDEYNVDPVEKEQHDEPRDQ